MKLSWAMGAALAAVLLDATAASAHRINTGGADAPYHAHFCPVLAQHLKLAQFEVSCSVSGGARETIERVVADPRQLAYALFDQFAHLSLELEATSALTIVRHDDVRQCLYAVTRNRQVTTWAELAGNARRLRFILPPVRSDSSGSFSVLRALDPNGLGRAAEVRHTDSIDRAIREALSAEDTVSLFVQLPDPGSERFALIQDLGGHVVPVVDRTILRQEAGGRKIYFAEETEVENPSWIKRARKVVTACTPVLLFTGSPGNVAQQDARKDHEDLIRTIAALEVSALMPPQSRMGKLWQRTKELSASGTETVLEAGQRAREEAKPYTDKAMEAANESIEQARAAAARAGEAAKPYVDKSKAAAAKAYQDARRMANDLMQTKPESPPPKP
jgi:hypothetical protein